MFDKNAPKGRQHAWIMQKRTKIIVGWIPGKDAPENPGDTAGKDLRVYCNCEKWFRQYYAGKTGSSLFFCKSTAKKNNSDKTHLKSFVM